VLWVPLIVAITAEHLSHAPNLPVVVVVLSAVAGAILGVGAFVWQVRTEEASRPVLFVVTFAFVFGLFLILWSGSEAVGAAIGVGVVGASIGSATATVEAYVRLRRERRKTRLLPPAPPAPF
jgi:formate/nitrite transporter FocA (FNT family)